MTSISTSERTLQHHPKMAFNSERDFTRLCILVIVFASAAVALPFSDESFFTYGVSQAEANVEPQDSFIPDMVFLVTGDNARFKRQLNGQMKDASTVSPEEEKTRVPGRKKVPSSSNSTSASSGKPSKLDSSSASGVFAKEKPEKVSNPAKTTSVMQDGAPNPSTTPTPPVVQSDAQNSSTASPVTPSKVTEMHVMHPIDHEMDHRHGEVMGASHGTVAAESDDDPDKFPGEVTNATLAQHNLNKTEDHHQYYNSTSHLAKDLTPYWVEMDKHPNVTLNTMLSQAHRRAATVTLSFDFPFYGHLVRNVTIATGGFLYTGEYVHSWLAATQYIAPLMANFDTSISNASFVKYVDNGTSFTVEWCKVVLQDRPTSGEFSFQATLHKNGDILFVYRSVPVQMDKIKDDNHPVKVGLSDAYIIDRTIFFVRRKTIYEYHRVNFGNIQNGSVIYLKALPTCLDMKDCTSCLTKITSFECNWCESARRCSNGMDRHRQDWLLKNCEPTESNFGRMKLRSDQCSEEEPLIPDTNHVHNVEEPAISSKSTQHNESPDSIPIISQHDPVPDENLGVSMSGIVGILLLVVMACSIALWVLYAYRHPHSTSGQWLIRYRPSTWGWRRGEARYTAATIHM